MADNLRFRFDQPKPGGPALVYLGCTLVAIVGRELSLIVSLEPGQVEELLRQWKAHRPTAFWLSWWHTDDLGAFELRWPWWWTGTRMGDGARSVCAAIRAETVEDALGAVLASYDTRHDRLAWRFASTRPDDWSPFSERFSRAKWMRW